MLHPSSHKSYVASVITQIYVPSVITQKLCCICHFPLLSLNAGHIAISSEEDLQNIRNPTSFIAHMQQAV